MGRPPNRPMIYHITHVENLATILAHGELLSDAKMTASQGAAVTIGMTTIKDRRLALPVECNPGDKVGDYVPFYFCPRSIMLYVIHRANHPGLSYRGGQQPIIHLEADLHEVIEWAEGVGRRWAFSLSNAGSYYAQFYRAAESLDKINWNAVASNDFQSATISEGKQAEFLVHNSFPSQLFSRIGVRTLRIQAQVERIIASSAHETDVQVRPEWYY